MEIADIVVFIADEYAPTKDMYNVKLNGEFTSSIENKYSKKCSIVFFKSDFDSIKDIESKIKERFDKSQKENKLYLSIGVLDLVNINYRKHTDGGQGKYGIPKIALMVLNQMIIPYFKEYHFRSVIPTNIYNHFNEKFDEFKDKSLFKIF